MKITDENIVLIVMDTLSAFNTPMHGYKRDTTPFLKEFSERNTLVNYGYSNAPWTAPSHASLFSGKLPSEHGTSTHSYHFGDESFVEELNEKDYRTIGVSENPLISEELGFDKGFDKLVSDKQKIIFRNQAGERLAGTIESLIDTGSEKTALKKYKSVLNEVLVNQKNLKGGLKGAKYIAKKKIKGGFIGAEQTTQLAKKYVSKIEEDSFFLFINYMSPHAPYQPPEETLGTWCDDPEEMKEFAYDFHHEEKTNWWKEYPEDVVDNMRALYDEEILFMDRKIEELVNFIQEEKEDTIFIIVSDHGENINHYGMRGHNCGIWERLIRVPIIIGGDGIGDDVLDEKVSLKDLKSFINGKKNLSEITREAVRAEYKGARGILDHHNKPLDYTEEQMEYINNRSNTLIINNKGITRNTKLADVGFIERAKGFSEENKLSEVEDIKEEIKEPFDLYLD